MNKLNCLQQNVKGLSTYIHLIGGQKENSLHIILYKQGRIQKELKGVLCRLPPPLLSFNTKKMRRKNAKQTFVLISNSKIIPSHFLNATKYHSIQLRVMKIWITFFDYKTVWCFNPVFIRIIILLLVCQVNQHIHILNKINNT